MAFSNPMIDLLASSLPAWEPALALLAAMGLSRSPRPMSALAMLLYGLLVLCIKDPSTSGMAAANTHPLALAHMWAAWCGKIGTLTLICFTFCGPAIRQASLRRGLRRYPVPPMTAQDTRRFTQSCLQATIVFQALGITLGMFWAFDDPMWGALWQWDFVEMTALFTWIVLTLWRFDMRRPHIWATIALSIILFQSCVLYGGLNSPSASRHAYGENHAAHLWTLAVGLWACSLAIWSKFSAPLDPWITWYHAKHTKSHKTWAEMGLYVAFVMTLITAGLLPQNAQSQWVSLEDTGPYQLIGIRLHPTPNTHTDTPCVQYQIMISAHQTDHVLPLLTCPTHAEPLAHADVWAWTSPKRLWALQYRADQGAEILIRPIHSERFLQLLLIMWMLGMLGGVFLGLRPKPR